MPAQPWLNRSCPACSADVGEPCTGDDVDTGEAHPERLTAGLPVIPRRRPTPPTSTEEG